MRRPRRSEHRYFLFLVKSTQAWERRRFIRSERGRNSPIGRGHASAGGRDFGDRREERNKGFIAEGTPVETTGASYFVSWRAPVSSAFITQICIEPVRLL